MVNQLLEEVVTEYGVEDFLQVGVNLEVKLTRLSLDRNSVTTARYVHTTADTSYGIAYRPAMPNRKMNIISFLIYLWTMKTLWKIKSMCCLKKDYSQFSYLFVDDGDVMEDQIYVLPEK